MLQQDRPDDYILATGKNHTVREFAELAFYTLGIEIEWQGKNENEVGIDTKSGKKIIRVDKSYYRPTEVKLLLGDASKAKEKLGWEPKTSFKDLVRMMTHEDLKKVRRRGY